MKAIQTLKNNAFVLGLLACLYTQRSIAQTTTQNFIKKTVPISAVTSETSLNALSQSFKIEGISYIDGLGRPLQNVLIKGSPNSNDVIQPILYDQYGRSVRQQLSYTDASLSGTYRTNSSTTQPQFYTNQTMVAKTSYPYSEVVFDGSPLNKVLETSAPDTDWQLGNGHTSKTQISTNGDLDVFQWQILSSGDVQPVPDFYYLANTLISTKSTDPNGNYSYSYTDKNGRLVCTKQFLELRSGTPYYLTTYLVYDDFGQVVMVIPPKAMDLMDASGNYSINALTQDLIFRYTYDERHRLIEKKVPGTGWVYIVYNQLNQAILFRDANLTAQNKWSFVKYDVLGRPILSGLFNSLGLVNFQTRALAQAQFNLNQVALGESEVLEDASNPYGYTNVTLPNLNLEILTVNYYDDYDFDNNGTADYTYNTATIPCIVFNITLIQTVNSAMKLSVETGTTTTNYLNTAKTLSEPQASLYTALTNCITQHNSLMTMLNSNYSQSQSLLQVESTQVATTLKNSLSGQTLTAINNLQTAIANCISLNNKSNSTLTNLLTTIANSYTALKSTTNSAVTNLGSILSGCQPYTNVLSTRTRGYLTGSRVKVLNATNPVQWEIGATFYDDNGYPIQSQSNDHMGATDLINTVYDFVGNVIHTQQLHTLSGQSSIQVLNHFSFDKMGRLTRVDQKNNTDFPVILSNYSYNELSQLIDKKMHSINNGTTFLQSLDYRYTIQGWLSSINNIDLSSDMLSNPLNGTNDDTNDLWGMQLSYNTNTTGVNGVKQYAGNVSEKKWRSVTDNVKRAYGYDYDKIDRIKSSSYVENTTASTWTTNIGRYDEKDLAYDANGNITALKRYGYQVATGTFGLIDNLSYQYNGNFLGSVTDASTTQGQLDFQDHGSTGSNEYTFDGNGNIISNPNKGITNIQYNFLNLPTVITFNTGNKIEYLYDASCVRLQKTVTTGTIVTKKNYASLFEYVDNSGTQVLESMATADGRCVLSGTTVPQFRYEYQFTDNTGNVVMAFSDLDANGLVATNEVIQQSQYYSYGMRMEGLSTLQLPPENKYKFSGKELDDELGLNELDFGARFYDPAIGRWGCIDPMADAAPHWTPFRYGFDNPVSFTDPTGMSESDLDADQQDNMKARDDRPFADGTQSNNYALVVAASTGTKTPVSDVKQVQITFTGGPKVDYGGVGPMVSDYIAPQKAKGPTFADPQLKNTGTPAVPTSPGERTYLSSYSKSDQDVNKSLTAFYAYGGNGKGDFADWSMYVLDNVRTFSPLTQLSDAANIWTTGTDTRGIPKTNMDGVHSVISGIPAVAIDEAVALRLSRSYRGYQNHHVITNQNYIDFQTELDGIGWKQNSSFNLKKLPAPFHGNHPAYSAYVKGRIQFLIANDIFNIRNMTKLQWELRRDINKILKETQFQRMNDYFKHLGY